MFILEAVPAIAYGVAALRVPESPRYLVGLGRDADAEHVLRTCTGLADPRAKIEEIRGSLQTDRRASLRDLAGRAFGLKPIVWVGILVAAAQQFVGINVIFYYSTTLWRSVGFGESNALLITAITSLINISVDSPVDDGRVVAEEEEAQRCGHRDQDEPLAHRCRGGRCHHCSLPLSTRQIWASQGRSRCRTAPSGGSW